MAGHGEIAKQYDNVYLELTSIPEQGGALETMVNIRDRKILGTDMPRFDEHQGIGGLAQISDDDVHNILHRNAENPRPFI